MKNLQDVFLEFVNEQHRFWGKLQCKYQYSFPDLEVSANGDNLYCTLTFNSDRHYCCWAQSCHIGFRYEHYWEEFRELLSKAAMNPSRLCLHVKVKISAGATFANRNCCRQDKFGYDAPFSALKLHYEDTIQEAPTFDEFINDGAVDISSPLRDCFHDFNDHHETLEQRHGIKLKPSLYETSGAIKGHTIWIRRRLLSSGDFDDPEIHFHTNLDMGVEYWDYLRWVLETHQVELPRRLKVIWEQITEAGATFYSGWPWSSTETFREWMLMWEEIPDQPEPEGVDTSYPSPLG
ncbi:hypothetical protein ACNKU7_12130 [Microbulbifer sp. SA54]|uniref:hypothetical protein n=1 Tax=Microbulbifer sp. SA54 TaxID=3401577 RepID=UPI003AB05BB7